MLLDNLQQLYHTLFEFYIYWGGYIIKKGHIYSHIYWIIYQSEKLDKNEKNIY